MGKITYEQKQIIESFSCERLSDKQENRNLINNYDKEHEENEQIIRVGHTYPGIEIVHFCFNDTMKEKWKSFNINRPIGEVMFWQYIAPTIYEIQERIRCQYAHLFAASRVF